MRHVAKRQPRRRLTVISRQRPWNVTSFAEVFAAYVLQQLAEQDQSDQTIEDEEVTV
jgi:hypothetical protein